MIGKRIVAEAGTRGKRKYGKCIAESKDGTCWIVLFDGARSTRYIVKGKVEVLKPEQLAFHWGK